MKRDDRELFRESLGDVKPLRAPARVTGRPPPPRPEPRQRLADEAAALRESLAADPEDSELETGEHLWFLRSGMQRSVLRKLRRGQFRIEAELDLHGSTAEQARRAVQDFVAQAHREGLRCLRIVHGKGLGSGAGGPVLKRRLGAWLRKLDAVLAYCSARPADGGTGAVYVLLAGLRQR